MKREWETRLLTGLNSVLTLLIPVLAGVYASESAAFEIGAGVFQTALFAALFLVMFGVHILVHEAGHLLFGLISGYGFSQFRVGTLTLIRDETGLFFKRTYVPGTAGQCLMSPPAYTAGFPYRLYSLGGGLLNALLCALALAAMAIGGFGGLLLLAFAAAGLLTAVSNLIPARMSGIDNDGMNVLLLSRSETARKAMHGQLAAVDMLSKGVRPGDLPEQLFDLPERTEINNALIAGLKGLEFMRYLDREEYEKAAALSEAAARRYTQKGLMKQELNLEWMFSRAYIQKDLKGAAALMTKALEKRLVKSKRYDVKRMIAAYYFFAADKPDKGFACYEQFLSLAPRAPYPGVVEMDKRIFLGMLEQYTKEKSADRQQ